MDWYRIHQSKQWQFIYFFPNYALSTFVTAADFFFIPSVGYSTPQAPPQQSAGGLQVDFESVFGAKATGGNSLNSEGEELHGKMQ